MKDDGLKSNMKRKDDGLALNKLIFDIDMLEYKSEDSISVSSESLSIGS